MIESSRGHLGPIAAAIMISALTACASAPEYPAIRPANVSIKLALPEDSFFTSWSAYADVYSVDASCRSTLQGRLDLTAPMTALGVAPGQRTLLGFRFVRSSGFLHQILGGTTAVTEHLATITPKQGDRYELEVVYQDDGSRRTHSVTAFEIEPTRGNRKEIPIVGPCVGK